MEIMVDELILSKVSPTKYVRRFGKYRKIRHRFTSPFEVLSNLKLYYYKMLHHLINTRIKLDEQHGQDMVRN